MTGLFDILAVGAQTMSTHRRGLSVTGQNISNAATPGYHEQQMDLRSRRLGGVEAADLKWQSDMLAEQRVVSTRSLLGFHDTRLESLQLVEQQLGATGQQGLAQVLSRFESSWRELASTPEDDIAQYLALSRTTELAQGIRQQATYFRDIQRAANDNIALGVVEVNRLAADIANLNHSIAQGDPSAVLELRDTLQRKIESLAELMDLGVSYDARGMANVHVAGGMALVQGDTVRSLATSIPEGQTQYAITMQGGVEVDITAHIQEGKMAAWLQLRDEDMVQEMKSLDAWTASFVTEANKRHAAGFTSSQQAAGDLFVLGTGTPSSLTLAVHADIEGNPQALAVAAIAANVPGDGVNAASMADLTKHIPTGSRVSLVDRVAQLGVMFGQEVAQAKSLTEGALANGQDAVLMRDSVSSVSVEEQMVQLTQYQRAFQAASRTVVVVDELLADLMMLHR